MQRRKNNSKPTTQPANEKIAVFISVLLTSLKKHFALGCNFQMNRSIIIIISMRCKMQNVYLILIYKRCGFIKHRPMPLSVLINYGCILAVEKKIKQKYGHLFYYHYQHCTVVLLACNAYWWPAQFVYFVFFTCTILCYGFYVHTQKPNKFVSENSSNMLKKIMNFWAFSIKIWMDCISMQWVFVIPRPFYALYISIKCCIFLSLHFLMWLVLIAMSIFRHAIQIKT